jgi:DNA-binding response OmpR family regulator/anti-sigma regulatory factor (Ser/Thr protein kinase)
MRTILIIDDDDSFRLSLGQRLELEGFQVLEAADGAAGLALAQAQQPDLILSDILMPVLSGYALLAQLRQDAATADIPMILLTAKAEHEAQRLGMVLGADDYLCKPFSMNELLTSVHSHIHRHDSQRHRQNQRLHQCHLDLARTLPHELVTPLTGILGAAELIALETARPDKVRSLNSIVREGGERLHQTIDRILLYARLLQQDDKPPPPPLFPVASALGRQVTRVAELEAAAWQRSADLQLAVEPLACPVPVALLQPLLQELINNAFKFSKPGSPVAISLRSTDGQSLLTVDDRGLGMTLQQVRELSAFRQFDRNTREQKGLGLGLQIVQLIARQHQAQFELAPRPDGGLCATVVFGPIQPPASLQ